MTPVELPASPSPDNAPRIADCHSPLGKPSPTSPRPNLNAFPPWASHQGRLFSSSPPSAAVRRLSTRARPYSLHSTSTHDSEPLVQKLLRHIIWLSRHALQLYLALPLYQRILALFALTIFVTLTVLALIFSHVIFKALGPVASKWRASGFPGILLSFFLVCLTAFPPLMGYSSACTVTGFVYGFPWGWPIVALASVTGSLFSFLASRTVLASFVKRTVGSDPRFLALAHVLRHDGLLTLATIRFCPLPFSLSNSFLATVPSIRPVPFALATAAASPKLLVHVFIGSRLAFLAEQDNKMTGADLAVNYASMVVGAALGAGTGWWIWRRTMRRARDIEAEAAQQEGSVRMTEGFDENDDHNDDVNALLLDSEDVAALIIDNDDISLWDSEGWRTGEESEERGRYADGWDGDEREEIAAAIGYNEHGNENGYGKRISSNGTGPDTRDGNIENDSSISK